jgi:hypothetical protein
MRKRDRERRKRVGVGTAFNRRKEAEGVEFAKITICTQPYIMVFEYFACYKYISIAE